MVVLVLVEAENEEEAKKKAKDHFKDNIFVDVDEVMEPEEA